MKKYLLLITLSYLLFSCNEQDVQIYGDKHSIYFDKFYMNAFSPGTETADSTSTSFFFLPNDAVGTKADLVVNLAGRKLEKDLKFQLRVVEEGTTAAPDEYQLDDFYTFRANNIGEKSTIIQDTISVLMKRSERLKNLPNGVRLVVEIVPNDEVEQGQWERRRAVIILTNSAVKPLWWTRELEEWMLGKYSPKKYLLFLKHADTKAELNSALIRTDPSQVRKLVLKFKSWLLKQNPAVTEEDGSIMTVNV